MRNELWLCTLETKPLLRQKLHQPTTLVPPGHMNECAKTSALQAGMS